MKSDGAVKTEQSPEKTEQGRPERMLTDCLRPDTRWLTAGANQSAAEGCKTAQRQRQRD